MRWADCPVNAGIGRNLDLQQSFGGNRRQQRHRNRHLAGNCHFYVYKYNYNLQQDYVGDAGI